MNKQTAHLSDEGIARYRGRSMPPVELLAADRHLAICDECYGRMRESHGLSDTLLLASDAFSRAADLDATHLTYAQLAGLVDDQLGEIDREIAQSHLEFCAQCEMELSELRETSLRMAGPRLRAAPFGEKFIAFWRMPGRRIPALAAAGLAVVALLAFLVSIPVRKENAALRAKTAELETANQSLRAQTESMQSEMAALREENRHLREAPPGEVIVALNDGGSRITLDSLDNLSGVVAPQYEGAVKTALRSSRVRVPQSLAELRVEAGTLMAPPSRRGFALIAPVGVVVETDRPSFRWNPLEGDTSYTVSVYDSNLSKVAESEALSATQWSAPAALARGRVYIWQVRAARDGKEEVAPPPAGSRVKFRVLDQQKLEEIDRARRTYAESHLVLGLIYADAGLLNDAEREFTALLRANPQSSVARKLLSSVRAAGR